MIATAIERRQFGDLAEDVAYLRACGLTVAPFHGRWRVARGDGMPNLIDDDGLRGLARLWRARKGEG